MGLWIYLELGFGKATHLLQMVSQISYLIKTQKLFQIKSQMKDLCNLVDFKMKAQYLDSYMDVYQTLESWKSNS